MSRKCRDHLRSSSLLAPDAVSSRLVSWARLGRRRLHLSVRVVEAPDHRGDALRHAGAERSRRAGGEAANLESARTRLEAAPRGAAGATSAAGHGLKRCEESPRRV